MNSQTDRVRRPACRLPPRTQGHEAAPRSPLDSCSLPEAPALAAGLGGPAPRSPNASCQAASQPPATPVPSAPPADPAATLAKHQQPARSEYVRSVDMPVLLPGPSQLDPRPAVQGPCHRARSLYSTSGSCQDHPQSWHSIDRSPPRKYRPLTDSSPLRNTPSRKRSSESREVADRSGSRHARDCHPEQASPGTRPDARLAAVHRRRPRMLGGWRDPAAVTALAVRPRARGPAGDVGSRQPQRSRPVRAIR